MRVNKRPVLIQRPGLLLRIARTANLWHYARRSLNTSTRLLPLKLKRQVAVRTRRQLADSQLSSTLSTREPDVTPEEVRLGAHFPLYRGVVQVAGILGGAVPLLPIILSNQVSEEGAEFADPEHIATAVLACARLARGYTDTASGHRPRTVLAARRAQKEGRTSASDGRQAIVTILVAQATPSRTISSLEGRVEDVAEGQRAF